MKKFTETKERAQFALVSQRAFQCEAGSLEVLRGRWTVHESRRKGRVGATCSGMVGGVCAGTGSLAASMPAIAGMQPPHWHCWSVGGVL